MVTNQKTCPACGVAIQVGASRYEKAVRYFHHYRLVGAHHDVCIASGQLVGEPIKVRA